MYVDTVVLAGIGTVALMLSFFGGFGYFVYRDSHKKAGKTKTRPLV
ncbi:cytochrome c oxidase subunit CcoM [Hydrocarboniclastica marina]|nr:cytochrome c oxidase subunit CcoM [Hydrocarboniclastica marina]|tara:strand:- start:894 stop:1031 length:138 start_codon:yes stop_codon:yes gene_type:complete